MLENKTSEMNRVAIITMTGGSNYGNALQNYAVLHLAELCGYEATTIKISTTKGYHDSIVPASPLLTKIKPSHLRAVMRNRANISYGAKNDIDFKAPNIKRIMRNSADWEELNERKRNIFSSFQKEFLHYSDFDISNTSFNLPNLKSFAAFITGSDQVWNPNYRTNSLVEFLQMVPVEKRIAFAPSFGVSRIPEQRRAQYATWLSEIPYLSVRELEGAEIIKELTGKDVSVLFDPTFGITPEEWAAFSQKPSGFTLQPDQYVLCYFLGNRTSKYTKFIMRYAENHHCSIVDVMDIMQPENYCYSPQEFLWLLRHARAVFTDSFHGCAFSVIFSKAFVAFSRIDYDGAPQLSRIATLLSRTSLGGRLFSADGIKSVNQVDSIDFTIAERVVREERKTMTAFLQNALDLASVATCNPHLAPVDHCTGCGACANACGKHAIKMEPDSEGFLYPTIDKDLCVRCHNCETVCPQDKNTETQGAEPEAYYAFSRNRSVCENSSSGGVFSELACAVMNDGGIVVGAGFDRSFAVCHTVSETPNELKAIRTSKYVQSYTGNIYSKVKEALLHGQRVLFSGTPCQVEALRGFLGKDYEKLLLIDIICHGVPSPGLWKSYLAQEHSGKGIEAINFRSKEVGWNNFSFRVDYSDGTHYCKTKTEDPFLRGFLSNLSLRPSCYQCQYKTVSRSSDITLADYWGAESVHPKLDKQEGVSLVLVHTAKGREAFSGIQDSVVYGETDLDQAISLNSAACKSVEMPPNRPQFFRLCQRGSFKSAVSQCLKVSKSRIVRRKLRRFAHVILRSIGV